MSTLTQPRKKARRVLGGAPFGNTNAAKPGEATTYIHLRVKPADKGAWTDAANAAVRAHALEADARGNLAGWVVMTLNAAADSQLGPKGRAKRLRFMVQQQGGAAAR